MPLAAEIEDLANRIQIDMRNVQDYYTNTQYAWEYVRIILESNEDESSVFHNVQAGAETDIKGLEALRKRYIAGYLVESVFVHVVSLFEDFLFGLMRLWLIAHPAGIPNKEEKTVQFSAIIEAEDRDAIILGVIDRELGTLKYKRPAAWFRYLNDRVRLGGPSAEDIGRLAEMKASRDVIVHNRGSVNAIYHDKSGEHARHAIGDFIEIPAPYLRDRWSLVLKVVEEMTAAAITKS